MRSQYGSYNIKEEDQQAHLDTEAYIKHQQTDQCERNRRQAIYAPNQDLMSVVSSYTVFFDFDQSDIRHNEIATLDQAAREIDQYRPAQVTVTGYTDGHGSAEHNQTLSRQRAQAVSTALLKRGVENRTLDRETWVEYDRITDPSNNIENQENRRVVIDFRR
jgi:outer membrane protein OmpA-like peptidoglycan-associated protein